MTIDEKILALAEAVDVLRSELDLTGRDTPFSQIVKMLKQKKSTPSVFTICDKCKWSTIGGGEMRRMVCDAKENLQISPVFGSTTLPSCEKMNPEGRCPHYIKKGKRS